MLNRPNTALDALKPLLAALGKRFGVPALSAPAPQLLLPAPAALNEPTRAEQFLDIPIPDHSNDDAACQTAQSRGQFLARQDRWDELSAEIRSADEARDTTPGGMPIADLLAYGARSDVIHAVEHGLQDNLPVTHSTLTDGISGLEEVRAEYPQDPYIAMIVAHMHVDIAWAWRGTNWDPVVPKLNRARFAAHFDRASDIMQPYCFLELNSPSLAACCCALLAGKQIPGRRIADTYEDLIDLDPHNHRHMRALGNHMLPRWFGSYTDLELEARRTAARTQDIWGAGGYTWVCFDAIAIDDQACANVDVPFFLDGLHDIVAARPNQEMINLLAAYCAVAMRNGLGLNQDADLPRMQISDAASWLIRDHLTEVHPLIWAHAADGFDNNSRVTSSRRFAARGRADALQVIADMFQDEISQGLRVTFTPNGPKLAPG
ncbi:hypothetical protein K3727_14695 [Rhodobacteraceae bacterium M382]|nr:hypothetical protein K3727_14695 [Rhodobacteraceae bacterium M382]